MIKKVFASYSFSHRDSIMPFHLQLKEFLDKAYKVSLYSFVFDFKGKVNDKELMALALQKVDESDLVLVELSNKSVGVGIEAGYAKARGKTIIYLHKTGTNIKQAMNGIADHVVEYEQVEDVINWIKVSSLF